MIFSSGVGRFTIDMKLQHYDTEGNKNNLLETRRLAEI